MPHFLSTLLDRYLNGGWRAELHNAPQMRRVRTLVAADTFCLMLVVPFLVRAYQFEIHIRMISLPLTLLLAVASLVSLRLFKNETGLKLGTNFLASAVFAGGIGSILTGGGVGSANQGWLMLVPLLAGITLGVRGAVIWGVIALSVILAIGIMQFQGFIFINQTPVQFQRIEAMVQAAGLLVAMVQIMISYLSQLKHFEQMVEQRNLALVQQVAERENAEKEARNAEVAKTQFLRNMSHELRTPLNSILGFSQRLERNLAAQLDARSQQGFQHITESSTYLVTLLDDIFDLTSIDSGSLTLAPGMVEVQQLLAAVQRQLQPLAELSKLKIELQESQAITIEADARRLQQALSNMVRHSLKHADVTTVILSAWQDDKHNVYIDVTDDATAYSADERARLFDRYNHVIGGNERGLGESALGMALAGELIQLHSGTVNVLDTAHGNCFRVTLPKSISNKI